MSLKGIDVSAHQGVIDWKKVKASGIEFAIIRAGYGLSTVDRYFKANIQGAINAGIAIGTYWFMYALTDDDAVQNAKMFIQTMDPYKRYIKLKAICDFEYDTETYAKKHNVTFNKDMRTRFITLFCEELKANGYEAAVYLNPDYIKSKVNKLDYPLWLAEYANQKSYDCYMWQYGSKGRVNGIKGYVDMDILFECIEEEKEITALQKMDIQKGNPQQFAQIVKNIKTALNVDYGLSFLIDDTIDDVLLINLANVNLSTKAYTYNSTYALTQLLKWWGYGIEPTSQYGNAVSAIIFTFQSQVGITVTGTTTADTWKKLLGK